jgi:hypothetical protein
MQLRTRAKTQEETQRAERLKEMHAYIMHANNGDNAAISGLVHG